MMINDKIKSGIVLMVITAFLWSIAGLFIKIIDWNPFNIACARSFIASLFIIIFVKNIKFKFSIPLIAAGIANALTMILFITANKTTTVANAIVLQYISPMIIAILSFIFLKEKIKIENIICIFFIITGIIIMFFDKLNGGTLFGNILALCSALTFSLYFIFMRLQKDGSTIESVLLAHLITVIICFSLSLFFPIPKFAISLVFSVLILGIFQIGISSVLFSMAIKRIPAITASLISVIEPVLNPVWVFIILSEKPQFNTIIGGVIIILSVTVSSIITANRKLT